MFVGLHDVVQLPTGALITMMLPWVSLCKLCCSCCPHHAPDLPVQQACCVRRLWHPAQALYTPQALLWLLEHALLRARLCQAALVAAPPAVCCALCCQSQERSSLGPWATGELRVVHGLLMFL